MLRRFLDWWMGELNQIFPARRALKHLDELRLHFSPATISVEHIRSGHATELVPPIPTQSTESEPLQAAVSRLSPGKTRVSYVVDKSLVLTRALVLPEAAEENLGEVLSFEMERQTPFRADDVFFDYEIASRNSPQREIEVNLYVVPKKTFIATEKAMTTWPLTPADTRYETGQLKITYSPFAPAESRRISSFLVVVNVALLIAVIVVPIAYQKTTLEQLREELVSTREQALQAAETQAQVEAIRAQLEYLNQRKSNQVPLVELINEVSRLLPDTTWLLRLELKDETLHLRGYSQAASSLIARIDNTNRFTETRFASPVTKDNASGTERFYITTRLSRSRPSS